MPPKHAQTSSKRGSKPASKSPLNYALRGTSCKKVARGGRGFTR